MKQKHLTLEEREIIEDMLKNNFNFTEIGKVIGKHRTTISKEILNHRFEKKLYNMERLLLIVLILIIVNLLVVSLAINLVKTSLKENVKF